MVALAVTPLYRRAVPTAVPAIVGSCDQRTPRECQDRDYLNPFALFNPSAWSDGHCPHTVNITCRGVTGTARIQ